MATKTVYGLGRGFRAEYSVQAPKEKGKQGARKRLPRIVTVSQDRYEDLVGLLTQEGFVRSELLMRNKDELARGMAWAGQAEGDGKALLVAHIYSDDNCHLVSREVEEES